MSTAIEQYFNRLIDHGELCSAVIADNKGETIIECFGTPNGEDGPYATNAVISANKTVLLLQQLLLGEPTFIAAQYREQLCVHFAVEKCLVTLVGSRSKDHSVGSLAALIPAIRATPVFTEVIESIKQTMGNL